MPDSSTLIRNARIIDGAGNPWQHGDLLLSGDRIEAIAPPGSISAANRAETVDASGLVACPGFIDIQSHSILSLMIDGRCLSKITQGVTTEIMGEAWTPAPVAGRHTDPMANSILPMPISGEWRRRIRGWTRFGDWLQAVADAGVSPNIGSFLGGGTLRHVGKGMEMGRPSAGELDLMRRTMAEAMEDGAFGVSYALIYPPDAYTDTEELIEICKVVSRYNGLYITHMRSEGAQLFEGLEEALTIGRRADLPVEIYHLKASGTANWHKMPSAIARIEEARAQGLDVTADMYPYAASGTGLSSLLPTWTAADGSFFENLEDPAMRARIRKELLEDSDSNGQPSTRGGAAGVLPVGFHREENQHYVGMNLAQIAAERGQDWLDCTIDLLRSEGQRIGAIFLSISEDNLRTQLPLPWIKVATDAAGVDPAWAAELGPTHPRAYGTYPRVLGHYVRERRLLTLEDAVRKMTGAVADRLGLRKRGHLRAGFYADLVLFDPHTISDRATFAESHLLSVGVQDVWVNGQRVLRDGEHTGAVPGRFVRRD
ncbi:MAG: D-aminoacylase [Caldilineaceae bacterium SB0661_bin_32]|uniref:D-aminoacylase n=1 Tax=Caldilineaceae bacterium SB0661_bin_32 TaxID=2605255 RepID=A0A6B1DA80_9CHLR|nr:D-aminoacylase [Caldilineaceae bacterium SB0661_bin_32]